MKLKAESSKRDVLVPNANGVDVLHFRFNKTIHRVEEVVNKNCLPSDALTFDRKVRLVADNIFLPSLVIFKLNGQLILNLSMRLI